MGNEIVKAEELGLAALSDGAESLELLHEALAGEALRMGDLERVKWPTGGAVKFERTVLGNAEHVESIEGVILHQSMSRSYWKSPEPVEGATPDCVSPDGKFGYGEPGDTLRAASPPQGCDSCPMAQFGSHPKEGSNAQACKLSRDIFMLAKGGGLLPLAVSIPPGSLPQGKGYFVDLASFGIRYFTVVTKLSLRKVTNKSGQPYAEAVFSMVGRLDDETAETVRGFREMMAPAFERMVPAAGDEAEVVNATAVADDAKPAGK